MSKSLNDFCEAQGAYAATRELSAALRALPAGSLCPEAWALVEAATKARAAAYLDSSRAARQAAFGPDVAPMLTDEPVPAYGVVCLCEAPAA